MDLAVIFSDSTLVPVGIAVAVGLTLIGVIIKLDRTLNEIQDRLDRIDERDRYAWTISDQRVWCYEFDKQNTQVDVPDPVSIHGDRS